MQKIHVKAYDSIVRNKKINRWLWNADINQYIQFVQKALDMPAGSKILDAACGPLSLTAKLYAQRPDLKLVLLDISSQALEIACKRLDKLNACDRIELVKATVFSIPYLHDYFDRIINLGFLHLFSDSRDILRALKEFQRVLKPGGKIFFMTLVPETKKSRLFLNLLYLLRQVGRPHKAQFFTDLISEAGFDIVEQTRNGAMLFIVAQKKS